MSSGVSKFGGVLGIVKQQALLSRRNARVDGASASPQHFFPLCNARVEVTSIRSGTPALFSASRRADRGDSQRRTTASASLTSSQGSAPALSKTGGVTVTSTMVEGRPPRNRPESIRPSTSFNREGGKLSGLSGGGAPDRLALVETRIPPADRASRAATGCEEIRIAALPVPACRSEGRDGAAGRISVRGPGQKALARRPADSGHRDTAESTASMSEAIRGSGFPDGLPLIA